MFVGKSFRIKATLSNFNKSKQCHLNIMHTPFFFYFFFLAWFTKESTIRSIQQIQTMVWEPLFVLSPKMHDSFIKKKKKVLCWFIAMLRESYTVSFGQSDVRKMTEISIFSKVQTLSICSCRYWHRETAVLHFELSKLTTALERNRKRIYWTPEERRIIWKLKL